MPHYPGLSSLSLGRLKHGIDCRRSRGEYSPSLRHSSTGTNTQAGPFPKGNLPLDLPAKASPGFANPTTLTRTNLTQHLALRQNGDGAKILLVGPILAKSFTILPRLGFGRIWHCRTSNFNIKQSKLIQYQGARAAGASRSPHKA